MKIKIILLMLVILLGIPLVLAADYYAKVNVYFNVPTDAAIKVGFPSTYSGSYNVTAANTTVTPWISFNFTGANENWVQPQTDGVGADKQASVEKPIFLVQNIGNTNIDIQINGTVPSSFAVCANSTCQGSCGGTTADCTVLGGESFTNMGTTVQIDSAVNITLWGNATGASGGQSAGNVFILSKPT